jgi:oligoribonuclease NrnB/cAMP/cGMP phosphodiesterase (DHH superfamily)
MKPLVIYHGNCADGFSAAWCFWSKYGTGADYFAGVYQKEPPDVTGRPVYLVDFSYPRSVVEQMLQTAHCVCLIDHHKSAIEDLQPLFSQGLLHFTDLNRSGATLAWDYLFFEEPRPLLLEHVEDRDLWRFALPDTADIMAFVFSHDYRFDIWDKLMSAGKSELLSMKEAGSAINRKHKKDVAELVARCQRRMVIGGHDVPVANIPYTMASDAGHLMAQGEPFAACYFDDPDGRIFSLRSTDAGLDVSAIAKQYGGGGHAKASGFKVPRGHPLTLA